MKRIQELLALNEAVTVPMEVSAVIKNAGGNHEEHLRKMWGGQTLLFHGDKFFDDNDLGPAYKKAMAAAEHKMPESISDSQETYLGYSPKTDALYIGFDAWGQEENDSGGDDEDEDSEHYAQDTFEGIVFEVTDKGGKYTARIIDHASGGFYKGIMQHFKKSYPHVVDLRLD